MRLELTPVKLRYARVGLATGEERKGSCIGWRGLVGRDGRTSFAPSRRLPLCSNAVSVPRSRRPWCSECHPPCEMGCAKRLANYGEPFVRAGVA